MKEEIIISESNFVVFTTKFQDAVINSFRVIEEGWETPHNLSGAFWAKLERDIEEKPVSAENTESSPVNSAENMKDEQAGAARAAFGRGRKKSA